MLGLSYLFVREGCNTAFSTGPSHVQGLNRVCWQVEDETLRAHKIILTARSAVFNALLKAPMREGTEGIVKLQDIRAPVFRALLHFVYTDSLPAVGALAGCLVLDSWM